MADTVAIYGAVLSTVAMGWNVYRDVYQRARGKKKKLTSELYSPVRQQLAEASEAVQKYQRALSVNPETWKTACSSGTAIKVKPVLRRLLGDLYERKLPSYDKSWQDLNSEIGRLLQQWDQRYGDSYDFHIEEKEYRIVTVDWSKFLTGESSAIPIDGLREGDVLRLWNAFMTPAAFTRMDFSVEDFLIKRRAEAANNSAMRQFRELRRQVLEDIPKAIALLDRNSSY